MFMGKRDRTELIALLAEHETEQAGQQELERIYYEYQVDLLDTCEDEELERLASIHLTANKQEHTMKKYAVNATVTCYMTVEVEANNDEEADTEALDTVDELMQHQIGFHVDEFDIAITGTNRLVSLDKITTQESNHGQ